VKDPEFINQMIEKGEAAREKARKELEGLSETQLNWKPDKDSWSIGQCLDHLIVTDSKYILAFQQIADRTYHMRSWEKWSPFSGLLGKMLVRNVGEIPRRKMKAPRVIRPTESKVGRDIMERFHAHLDKLLDLLSRCRDTDYFARICVFHLQHASCHSIDHATRTPAFESGCQGEEFDGYEIDGLVV
jgi:hypothetical protein